MDFVILTNGLGKSILREEIIQQENESIWMEGLFFIACHCSKSNKYMHNLLVKHDLLSSLL